MEELDSLGRAYRRPNETDLKIAQGKVAVRSWRGKEGADRRKNRQRNGNDIKCGINKQILFILFFCPSYIGFQHGCQSSGKLKNS